MHIQKYFFTKKLSKLTFVGDRLSTDNTTVGVVLGVVVWFVYPVIVS